jgi:hypothetical protein
MKHLKLGSGGIPPTKGLVTFVGLLTSSLEALHPPPKFFNCTSALRYCAVSYHHKPCPPATLSGNTPTYSRVLLRASEPTYR